MVPPPPIPIPGVSKSLLPGANNLEKNEFLMIFYDSHVKSKKNFPGGLKRGQ